MTPLKANIGSVRKGKDARASMSQILRNYNKLIRHLEDVTPEVLIGALEPTFEKSKEYCPKDTGAMVDSAYLEVAQSRGQVIVAMGYGFGGQPEYTARVHENLEWQHEPPTRAKWLQVALEEDEAEIEQRILSAYRGVFG